MAAGTWAFFDTFREWASDGSVDLDTDVFKVGLLTSAVTPLAATHDAWADLSGNEISNAGYTAGGFTITQTWVRTGASVVFDSDDPTWTASGADLVARWAVLYDDTTTTPEIDLLVCFVELEVSADVTAVDGNPLTIQLPAGGYFNQA